MEQALELRKNIDLTKLTKEQKKELIKDLYVVSPYANRIMDELDFCKNESKYKHSPICLCIYGAPGLGKTLLCNKYISKYPPYQLVTDQKKQTIKPILYTKVESTATEKSLATSLLRDLGDPFFLKGNTVDKKSRLVNLLPLCQVEMIIIDEIQHIYDKDSQKIIQSASNFIKNLIEDTKLPIILVGLPDVIRIIEVNEQLSSRYSDKHKYQLKPLSISTEKNLKASEFHTFLHVVDLKLPLPMRSNLDNNEIALELFNVSGGNLRILMQNIIEIAAIKAINHDLPFISKGLIMSEIDRLVPIELKPRATSEVNNETSRQKLKNKKEKIYRKALL
ncbi:MAG: TniB family NTP-binding protein [Bacillota bacterium]